MATLERICAAADAIPVTIFSAHRESMFAGFAALIQKPCDLNDFCDLAYLTIADSCLD